MIAGKSRPSKQPHIFQKKEYVGHGISGPPASGMLMLRQLSEGAGYATCVLIRLRWSDLRSTHGLRHTVKDHDALPAAARR